MGRPPVVGKARTEVRKTRMTPNEAAATDSQAASRGFGSTSDYLRHLVAVDGRKITMQKGPGGK